MAEDRDKWRAARSQIKERLAPLQQQRLKERLALVQAQRPPNHDVWFDRRYLDGVWFDRQPAPKKRPHRKVAGSAKPPTDKKLKGFVAEFVRKAKGGGKTPTQRGLWAAAKDTLPGATRKRLLNEFVNQTVTPPPGRPRKTPK